MTITNTETSYVCISDTEQRYVNRNSSYFFAFTDLWHDFFLTEKMVRVVARETEGEGNLKA